MTIILPETVRSIIATLRDAGFEAYAVGGCVRDSILGRKPDDWDITTSAKPETVKSLFRRTVDTGIQHGTVTVMLGKEGFEVTTYRIDGDYEDSRRPKQIEFTSNLSEDLKRRDFTINAMAYNDDIGLVDEFCGLEDMKDQMIRCVGEAEERFGEDALRIMRAIRFSAQLGYRIEESTSAAICCQAGDLRNISAERIQVELVKLLLSSHPDYLRVMYDTGVMQVVLPELARAMETPQHNSHHCYTVGEHTLHALTEVPADRVLRLAVLFHDIGKPDTVSTDEDGTDHFYGHPKRGSDITKEILRRLRFDNDTTDKVVRLVYWHDVKMDPTEKSVRRGIHRIGEDIFTDLFAVKRADSMAQSENLREVKLAEIRTLEKLYQRIMEKGQCVSLKDLAVNGRDLIDAGMKPGKELGVVLAQMLELVLEEPEYNTREILIGKALEIQHNQGTN